jgi:S-DNA-T family DNA segregation ATPase FtsK/SpoIIIE
VDFGVRATLVDVTKGPAVTRFELAPAPGVKVNRIQNLSDDIALKLAVSSIRIEPIPGKAAIGLEVPSRTTDPVSFRSIVDCDAIRNAKGKLCVGLGKDISGNVVVADLSKMPHLLVAGSTGSGKSVCINTIIASLLYRATPDEVKLILVDPKVVELTNYNGIPHLLTPVVTGAKQAASALHWAVVEMERRYTLFAHAQVRKIDDYNVTAEEKLPFIVVIIDELSDLMMVAAVDVEDAILRLAQKARAAGIHLILATQRPSVDVLTGTIKANIPSRIAFAVSSQIDSRTILDTSGAEKLLGKGDMLYFPVGANKPVRVQGAFIADDELARVVNFIKAQAIPTKYQEEVTTQELKGSKKNEAGENSGNAPAEDELFEDAVRLVMDTQQASSSMLQRKFRIGYTRAARLVDTMEEKGIVGPADGSKPRALIMSPTVIEDKFFSSNRQEEHHNE